MPDDALIEKLRRRCREANDALQAAQLADPDSDEVDFLADALLSARTALYLARAEVAASAAHAYVNRIAAGVREGAFRSAPPTADADKFAVVRLATGLLMQRHQLSPAAAAALLEGVCERYRVLTSAVAEQIVRDDADAGPAARRLERIS